MVKMATHPNTSDKNLQILIERLCKEDRYLFVICSNGRTATHWIAETLSMQPNTYCGHGGNFKKSRPELGRGYEFYVNRKNESFRTNMSDSFLTGLYHRHLNYTDCKYVGNAHAKINYHLAVERAYVVTDRILPLLVTRDPFPRITSSWRKTLASMEHPGRDVSWLQTIKRKYWHILKDHMHLVDSLSDLIFLSSIANVFGGMQDDFDLCNHYFVGAEQNGQKRPDLIWMRFESLVQLKGITELASVILGPNNIDESAIRQSVANGPIASSTVDEERDDPTVLWPTWGAEVSQAFYEKYEFRRAFDFFEYEWKV